MNYQGWTNSQTWCVALCFDNTEAHLSEALEICRGENSAERLRKMGIKRTLEIRKMAPWVWVLANLDAVNWTELVRHYKRKIKE